MERPRIKLGTDDRLLVFVLAMLMACGCVAQSGTGGKKSSPKKPAGTTLSAIAFDSFQKRDRLRAEKLRRLADDVKAGRLKYDGPVMEAIAKAGAEASEETWKPVADKLQALLGDGAKLDAEKCEKAIRELADGAEKAGAQ